MAKQKKTVTGGKMTDEELANTVQQETSKSLGNTSSKLSTTRARLMNEYLGNGYGDEGKDRSGVVTREVLETVEWMMPQLMRIFQGGEDVVKFEPQNQDDEAEARQATDYVNYVFNRQNPGFSTTYQWIKDGLLQKNGVVKIRWDDSKSKEREDYENVDLEEMNVVLADEDVEIAPNSEIESILDENDRITGYNFSVIRDVDESKTVIEPVPPEEFLITRGAKDIQNASFVAHRQRITLSELTALGWETEGLASGDNADTLGNREEEIARFSRDDSGPRIDTDESTDDTMQEVWLTEAYIRLDFDGDGIAELRQVLMVGNTILKDIKTGKKANDEVNWIPFAGWTPIIMSHKYAGLSVGELVSDIQRINSQLFRNMLDNQYIANHGKYEVLDGMVNMDDMLTGRAHGIVRVKMGGAVKRIDVPQLGQTAFQMLELTRGMSEQRTGVSARTQGLDENQLNPNTAATAVNQVMTAAQQRIELIARVFGETGYTDLFNIIYATETKFQENERIVRLNGEYVQVDPSSWRDRKDLSVVVGLGNGSKDAQMFQLNTILQNQLQMVNAGKSNLVGDDQLFASLNDQAKLFNTAADNRYFLNPGSDEAAQAKQEQQQAQEKQEQMINKQLELAQATLQIEQFKAQSKDEVDKRGVTVKEGQLQLNVQTEHDDTALKVAELGLEAEQERGVLIGD